MYLQTYIGIIIINNPQKKSVATLLCSIQEKGSLLNLIHTQPTNYLKQILKPKFVCTKIQNAKPYFNKTAKVP